MRIGAAGTATAGDATCGLGAAGLVVIPKDGSDNQNNAVKPEVETSVMGV